MMLSTYKYTYRSTHNKEIDWFQLFHNNNIIHENEKTIVESYLSLNVLSRYVHWSIINYMVIHAHQKLNYANAQEGTYANDMDIHWNGSEVKERESHWMVITWISFSLDTPRSNPRLCRNCKNKAQFTSN